MNEEIWKDAVGYEGRYQVSNLGRVRSIARWVDAPQGRKLFLESKLLSQSKDKVGYLHVTLLDKNHRPKRWNVHRLVAFAFIENPNNYPVVNHKDENKQNNCVSNLEWCSHSYNLSYRNGQKKRRQQKIEMYDRITGEYIRTFDSISEASAEVGVNYSTICAVAAGRYGCRSAGGYIWRYAKDSIRKRRGLHDEVVVLQRYPRKRKVEMLDINTEKVIRSFNTISEASKTMSVDSRQIQSVCAGHKYHHTAGGYKWRYADEI